MLLLGDMRATKMTMQLDHVLADIIFHRNSPIFLQNISTPFRPSTLYFQLLIFAKVDNKIATTGTCACEDGLVERVLDSSVDRREGIEEPLRIRLPST